MYIRLDYYFQQVTIYSVLGLLTSKLYFQIKMWDKMPDNWTASLTGPVLHLIFLVSIFDIHFKSPIVSGMGHMVECTYQNVVHDETTPRALGLKNNAFD